MCPECGTSIALSLGESTLANASPEYLRTVRRGLSFVLNGILLMVVAVVGGIVLNGVLVSAGMLAPDAADLLLRGLMFGVSVILTLGYFWYTTPDPGQVARETTRSARVVVRTVVLIQAALSLANLALTFIAGVSPGTANIVEMVVGALWLVTQALWAVQFFAVMRYTRWLATRAPDHFVIRRTRRYMWLLPVLYIPGIALFGLGPLIALVMYWNLLDRLRKHFKAIVKTGRPARLKGMLATGR